MKVLRRVVAGLVGIGLAAGVGLAAVGPAEAAPSSAVSWSNAKVVRWKDGDTVVTSRGTIRLIGVDTPETGRCGAATATKWAKKWAPVGSTVRLGNPKSVKDEDRYGRSLRYVVRKNVDLSKSQIVKGSKARYDSTDGYQWHPRQGRYHKADRAHKNYSCKKQSSGGFSTEPNGHSCPKSAPIKGNRPSHIYHMPGQRFYEVTGPEICFSTQSAAQRAGYRKSKV
jgi:endonuclease YncB( thermonuclease family)